MTTVELLTEFLRSWETRANLGLVSGLSNSEVLLLEMFAQYCNTKGGKIGDDSPSPN